METILFNLYLLLQARLAAITDGDKPVFRWIDHDLGQLEDEKPALSYPAILIEFDEFTFTDLAENCKMGEGNIVLKVVFDPYSSTSNITNPVFKEKGLKYYKHEGMIKQALDGWCPDETSDVYGPLDFMSASPGKERTDLRIRQMVFSIGIDDYSGATVQESTNVSIDLEIKF